VQRAGLIVSVWEERRRALAVVCQQPPVVRGAQSDGWPAVTTALSARLPQPWRTSSQMPHRRAIARRPTSTSGDSTCASSGACNRPAARDTAAECVAKRSSRSEPSGDRFGPAHPFTFAKVEQAPDPPLARKQRRRLRQAVAASRAWSSHLGFVALLTVEQQRPPDEPAAPRQAGGTARRAPGRAAVPPTKSAVDAAEPWALLNPRGATLSPEAAPSRSRRKAPSS
jgi:hypothetical protein